MTERTETPTEIVERLHASYCHLAGVTLRLRPDGLRLWGLLLRDYKDDDKALQEDLKIVIIHLRAQIQKEKRNPGSIKLVNLLQPEQFESDVAEAKFLRGRRRDAANLPPKAEPDGWRAWAKETYPAADIPARFADLPAEIQEEFHNR